MPPPYLARVPRQVKSVSPALPEPLIELPSFDRVNCPVPLPLILGWT